VRDGNRVPVRSRNDAAGRRGAGRPHDGRDRRAARQLRSAGPVLIARILIWNLYDSKASLDELREQLPLLPEGDRWISNASHERLGLITFGDDVPDLGEIPRLIGKEPEVAEEFDVE
jgi:hypothetical protein